jgi:hypothetical protein
MRFFPSGFVLFGPGSIVIGFPMSPTTSALVPVRATASPASAARSVRHDL